MLSPLPDDAPAAHPDGTMEPPGALLIVDHTEAELGDSGPSDPLFACREERESGLEVLRRRSASGSVSPVRREVRKLELYLAYVSIRQHTSAHVSMRQHMSAYVSIRQPTSAYVSTRQHASADVSGAASGARPVELHSALCWQNRRQAVALL
jgi:hypothetical protein